MKVYVLLVVIGACSFLASARSIHQQISNNGVQIAANILFEIGERAIECANYANGDTEDFEGCMEGFDNTGNSGNNNGPQYTGTNPPTTDNQPKWTMPAGGNPNHNNTGNLPPMTTPDNSNAFRGSTPPTTLSPEKREDIADRIFELLRKRAKFYN